MAIEGPVDHGPVAEPVGGDDDRTGDFQFLLQGGCHAAGSRNMCSHGAAHRRPERAAIAPITRRVRAERTDKKRIRRISPITGMSFYIVMETSLKQKIFLSRLDQIAEELPPQRPPMKFSFSPSGIVMTQARTVRPSAAEKSSSTSGRPAAFFETDP